MKEKKVKRVLNAANIEAELSAYSKREELRVQREELLVVAAQLLSARMPSIAQEITVNRAAQNNLEHLKATMRGQVSTCVTLAGYLLEDVNARSAALASGTPTREVF
jgi:hypothetical protein